MTDKKNDLQLAKQAIQAIIQQLNVSRIVYVDDYFEPGFDVNIVKGWLSEIPEAAIGQIQALLPSVPIGVSQNITFIELEKIWGNWSANEQKEIATRISAILGTRSIQDYQVANRLANYFPRNRKPQTFSPSEWEAQETNILSSAGPNEKILCIFDQDLSGAKAKGFSDQGAKSGIGLLKKVINQEKKDVAICCLLSHTIPTIENEITAWRNIAQENGVDLYQFLPLAKIRLADHESPLLFADGIKKAVLNIYCEKWKGKALEIINHSNDYAVESIKEIDVYDFDHMVFQVSLSEGISETEILVRLFQIFQKDRIRELFQEPQNFTDLSSLIATSRPISKIEIDPTIGHSFPEIRPIRRKELFETASLVIHTPLEVGDIFINTENNINYILLGQPCDLMVRSKGGLDGKRLNDQLLVPLVPIKKLSYKDFHDKSVHHWRTHSFIYYCYTDTNDIGEVCFAETIMRPVDILDLAVLDSEGICRLNLNQNPTTSISCTSGWKKRLETLIEQYSEDRGKLDAIQKHVNRMKNQDVKRLILKTSIEPRFYSKGIYNFNLQRIGRYRQPGADRLLKAYTQYLSRDADDVDFAKDMN